jgi:PIN domain nuclease of toxin-antitoxin system
VRVLLDTHVLLWWLAGDDRLPPGVGDLIDDPATRVHVSSASLWELVVKTAVGRLRLDDDPAVLFTEPLDAAGFRVLPVDRRHVLALPELPDLHRDPFDRMLVAQALVEDLDVVTGDQQVRRYPVRVVW